MNRETSGRKTAEERTIRSTGFSDDVFRIRFRVNILTIVYASVGRSGSR